MSSALSVQVAWWMLKQVQHDEKAVTEMTRKCPKNLTKFFCPDPAPPFVFRGMVACAAERRDIMKRFYGLSSFSLGIALATSIMPTPASAQALDAQATFAIPAGDL